MGLLMRARLWAGSHMVSDRGASAVEYGIMVAAIASVVIVAVAFLGQETSGSFSCVSSSIDAATAAAGC